MTETAHHERDYRKATVASAELRLQLERSQGFSALEETRPSLALALSPVLQRQRLTAASA